jgi:alanine racemase
VVTSHPPASHAPGLRRLATIDADVLARNIAECAAMCVTVPTVDARADGYGHGLGTVVRAALAAGVPRVRVSTRWEATGVDSLGAVVVHDGSVDLGLGIYGFLDDELEASLTLSSELVAVKPVPVGTGVSYGYTHRTTAATTLGLVALGYADGIPRLTSNAAFVSVAGTRRPLVGRIAMDQFVVDLGDSIAHVGDPVVLFGAASNGHPTVRDWANAARRSPADVTTGLGRRITRVVVTGEPNGHGP